MSETQAEAAIAEQESDADFSAGFTDKPAPTKTSPKSPEVATETTEAAAPTVEEYIQVKAKEWEEIRAARAAHDQQIAKQWGTIGQQQKQYNELAKRLEEQLAKAAAASSSTEETKDGFTELGRDYPEIAANVESGVAKRLEKELAAYEAKMSAQRKQEEAQRKQDEAMEELEDAHPDWKNIVGAPAAPGDAPNLEHPFRKWLSTKDAAYQKRINETVNPRVMDRAITRFQSETKAAAAAAAKAQTPAKPREDPRADRFRGAVQPRGDNGGVAATMNEDDEFAAGFKSR